MFHFENLDELCRRFMLEEISLDVKTDRLYVSPRLSLAGVERWPGFLKEAAASGDEQTLTQAIRSGSWLVASESSHSRAGRPITKAVPVNAPEILAEGELNRFYARASAA